MQGVQLHRGNWQQQGGKGSLGAPRSSLELGLAVLPELGPSSDTQLWLPSLSFSKPGAAPGIGAPLHWCLLVSWLALQWVGEIRLLHPQHQHGDGSGTTSSAGIGHPPIISTCHKGGLEHQLPWQDISSEPRGDPGEGNLKVVPFLPTPRPQPALTWSSP